MQLKSKFQVWTLKLKILEFVTSTFEIVDVKTGIDILLLNCSTPKCSIIKTTNFTNATPNF